MHEQTEQATVVIDPLSDPLRVARVKEQAIGRRRAKAARRLKRWTGGRLEDVCTPDCHHLKEGK